MELIEREREREEKEVLFNGFKENSCGLRKAYVALFISVADWIALFSSHSHFARFLFFLHIMDFAFLIISAP